MRPRLLARGFHVGGSVWNAATNAEPSDQGFRLSGPPAQSTRSVYAGTSRLDRLKVSDLDNWYLVPSRSGRETRVSPEGPQATGRSEAGDPHAQTSEVKDLMTFIADFGDLPTSISFRLGAMHVRRRKIRAEKSMYPKDLANNSQSPARSARLFLQQTAFRVGDQNRLR
jgi:hypothetical protein